MTTEKTGQISYYVMYLRKFLTETDSPRKHDDAYINERAGLAEEEFEASRRNGLSVFDAQERAMSVLVQGLSSE